ncbi:MAG: hypothetical protein ACRDL7_13705, partial [Gaiellaceae bacterium]
MDTTVVSLDVARGSDTSKIGMRSKNDKKSEEKVINVSVFVAGRSNEEVVASSDDIEVGRIRSLREVPVAIHFHEVHRRNIRAGHLVFLRNRDMIPADLVLLASSGDDGGAYIETSSIDGETNLKLRTSAKPPSPHSSDAPPEAKSRLLTIASASGEAKSPKSIDNDEIEPDVRSMVSFEQPGNSPMTPSSSLASPVSGPESPGSPRRLSSLKTNAKYSPAPSPSASLHISR